MKRRGRGNGRRHPRLEARTVKCLCGKIYSPTEAAAKELRKETEASSGHHSDVRFYECDYSGHHWTRQVDPKYKTHEEGEGDE